MADALDKWEQWLQRLEEGRTGGGRDAEQPVEEIGGNGEATVSEPQLRRSGEEPSRT